MLSIMFPQRARAVSADDERIWSSFGGGQRTRAGVDVNEDVALIQSAVFRCSRLLAEPPSGLPLRCYRRKDEDRKIAKLDEVPAIEHVSISPNPDMSAGVFREGRILHQVNWGNGFAEIVRDRSGRVTALWPIHPARVSPAKPDSGYAYAVRNSDGTTIGLRRDEMLHICGTLSDDGIWGRGVIAHARENIGMAIGAERHGAAYFGSGAQPKGVVIAPGLSTPALREQFRREWKEIHDSPDSAEVAILPKDGGYTPITISNSDNQFVEVQGKNLELICAWYGVPLYMLGTKTTTGTLERLSAEFVIYSLYPWVARLESQLNFKLLSRSQWNEFYFEHDFSALLKGDLKTRLDAYRVGLTTGIYTINECRRIENLPGIGPAGDVHYVPANLFTASQMMNGNPSNMGQQGPGSDHNGAPADNPLDHDIPRPPKQPHSETTFEGWRRSLPKMQAEEVARQMREFESQLEHRPVDYREPAKEALLDVLGRLFTKESNAAAHAAKGNNDFDRWLHEFYGKHETLMCGALKTACWALGLAGVKKWESPAELAAWLKARSVEAMRHSYDHDSPDVFARRLADWPTKRAADIAEEVLQG